MATAASARCLLNLQQIVLPEQFDLRSRWLVGPVALGRRGAELEGYLVSRTEQLSEACLIGHVAPHFRFRLIPGWEG
jgi:hypothetical protein